MEGEGEKGKRWERERREREERGRVVREEWKKRRRVKTNSPA